MGSGPGKLTIETLRILKVFLDAPTEPQYGLELAEASALPSGSIYPILARLEKARWIHGDWEQIDPVKEKRRPRRYYRLTASGKKEARNALFEARLALSGDYEWAKS